MKVTIRLPYIAPNLNDLIRDKGEAALFAHLRKLGRRTKLIDGYNAAKDQWHTRVRTHVLEQRIPTDAFEHGAHVAFRVVERDRRRDPDNFCGGSTKLVLDGLVKCRVLPNDGWGGVLSLSYQWEVGAPCVEVTLSSEPIQRAA